MLFHYENMPCLLYLCNRRELETHFKNEFRELVTHSVRKVYQYTYITVLISLKESPQSPEGGCL